MHALALHVLPILAAEKSKTAFYIAGGALAIWAVVISIGFGLRRPDFPHTLGGERTVIGITVALVLAAMSTAVLTSGVPAAQGGVSGAGGAKATASTLSLAADPSGNLRFDKTQLRAPAGRVTIDFTNTSQVAHNVTVAAQAGGVIGATSTATGKATLSLTLKPGTYVYYCSVPGHRQAGMQGTLVVH